MDSCTSQNQPVFGRCWFPTLVATPGSLACFNTCVKAEWLFCVPNGPPAVCPVVTQPLNPVRPKWLRPHQVLNLSAPFSDRLRTRCTRHMVFITCVRVYLCSYTFTCAVICLLLSVLLWGVHVSPTRTLLRLHSGQFAGQWWWYVQTPCQLCL